MAISTYIIAEAGTGHFAEEEIHRYARASQMIESAIQCGADAVKFQLFVPEEPLFCPLPGDEKRWERWRKTLLPFSKWKKLAFTFGGQIDVLWSVFQPTAVKWIADLGPRYCKVASRAADNFPYDALRGPFLVSTDHKKTRFDITHGFYALKCVQQYPAPLELCGWEPGYSGLSDHSGTVWPGLDAIAHGARFLEVHFRTPWADMGNDADVALDPKALRLLCEARNAFTNMHQNTH